MDGQIHQQEIEEIPIPGSEHDHYPRQELKAYKVADACFSQLEVNSVEFGHEMILEF